MREKKKHMKVVHKKRLKKFLMVILIVLVIGCVWKEIRKTGSIPCSGIPNPPTAAYSENDAVLNAIALSYLVYGCETCNELSGTVGELLETHDMGILIENFGIMVQSLMFLGDYKAVEYHVYPENGYTTDTHCAFSFIAFEDETLKNPRLP